MVPAPVMGGVPDRSDRPVPGLSVTFSMRVTPSADRIGFNFT